LREIFQQNGSRFPQLLIMSSQKIAKAAAGESRPLAQKAKSRSYCCLIVSLLAKRQSPGKNVGLCYRNVVQDVALLGSGSPKCAMSAVRFGL